MDESGELADWNDTKGFGFVRASDGVRLFVHVSAFGRLDRRPAVGDTIRFRRGIGRDGRPAVVTAALPGSALANTDSGEKVGRAQTSRALRIALAALLVLALVLARRFGHAPVWLPLVYVVLGPVSAVAYWLDKRAARSGRWRVAESTLHWLDFAGGIAGGLLAQAGLHHKTAKTAFAPVTLAIGVGHLAFLAAVALRILDLDVGR